MTQLQDDAKAMLAVLRQAGLERTTSTRVVRPGSEAAPVDLSSNDYLGLRRDPLLLRALAAVEEAGAGASRLIGGTLREHDELERQLADFFGTDACLVFGAGYLANLGTVSTIAARTDTIFSDKLVHASVLDGAVLSRARHQRFRHNDMNHLRALLQAAKNRRRARERFVLVAESVYSMDGDRAPVKALASLAREFDAVLMLDEAHAVGVLGPGGRGAAAEAECEKDTALVLGTLSKALGSYGGFAAVSEEVRALLVNKARPFIYNTALPPACAKAASAALRWLRARPSEGDALLAKAAWFRRMLQARGFSTLASDSQIVPVVVGEAAAAVELSRRLFAQGVIAPAIRPPTVPAGAARLRLSLSRLHTEAELERVVDVLTAEGQDAGLVA